MSYGEKKLVRMNFPSFDFGGTANTEIMAFDLPVSEKGVSMQAQLVDIGVMVTEATVFATTLGTVKVGTAGTAAAFATLSIPDASADASCVNIAEDTDAITEDTIPSGTLVQVTFAPGTGASLAGIGIPYIDMYVW